MNARPESAPGAQLPAEFRSALELAQAAVWDWQLEEDCFQVDANWARAFSIDVSAARASHDPAGNKDAHSTKPRASRSLTRAFKRWIGLLPPM